MTVARSGAFGGPAGDNGYAFVAGGGSADGDAYRFATIKTDKDDYAPGERAVITGSGWQPGEDVRLVFQEDPAVHDDYVLNVTADPNGDIYWDQWAPEQHDLNVRFYLSADYARSWAQMTFTDGAASNGDGTMVVSPATVTAGSTGKTFTFTFAADNGKDFGAGSKVNVLIPSGWTAPRISPAAQVNVIATPVSCSSAAVTGVSGQLVTVNIALFLEAVFHAVVFERCGTADARCRHFPDHNHANGILILSDRRFASCDRHCCDGGHQPIHCGSDRNLRRHDRLLGNTDIGRIWRRRKNDQLFLNGRWWAARRRT